MTSRNLNKQQIDAVEHKKGPLLIIAGAGTGKTTVITERIKYLISSGLAKPNEILALSFTEKASFEMVERVDQEMPYGYTQMWISTFHSFCDKVLRAEALEVGLNPRYRLLTEAESIGLLRENIFELGLSYFRPLGNPNKFLDAILKHFSRLQDEDIAPGEYIAWVNSKIKTLNSKPDNGEKLEIEKWSELAQAYKKFDEIKIRKGLMDFGDLIVKTLDLFRKRPNILSRYREQFKYILVDEFQDTNFAQNELAILLSGNQANITVCGDDDQSIYRFRGAAVSNIFQFRRTFPKAKVVVLTKNYRSIQKILDASYKLIQNNNPDRLEVIEGIDKKLSCDLENDSGGVFFIHAQRGEEEAELVAKKVLELVDSENFDFRDFAVLVRANNQAESFVRAFSRAGVPYQFLGPGRLFRQPEVVDFISYLKVLYDPTDSVSFYRVLSLDHLKIDSRDVSFIGSYAKKNNMSLYEAAECVGEINNISEQSKEKVLNLVRIIKHHLGLIKKETAGQILYYFLEETGIIKNLVDPSSEKAENEAKNISKFFDKLKSFETDYERADVYSVVDWIDLSMELGESPLASTEDWGENNAVNILTVHSSKGLEFPVVFLVNLVEQRFPSIERRELIPIPDELIKETLPSGDYHLQEERRLFYVGMTRAQKYLFFSAADYYSDGKRQRRLSPFLFEALGEDISFLEQKNAKQLSFLDYSGENKAGLSSSRVKHVVYYLSYSQIRTFEICPLHYKLSYVLKIPTSPSPSMSFGTSVHETLKDFYNLVKSGRKPGKKLLEEILKDDWIRAGYKSKRHEKEAFEKALIFLREYYDKEFDYANLPILVEQDFSIPLYEETESGREKVRIGGKMDRVDLLSNGGIEIVDYKTGEEIPTQKEADKDLQLSIYALAATCINTEPFGKNVEDIKLSLYYFEDQTKIVTKRSKAQLEEAKKKIFEVKKEIENSDFRCSGSYICRNCEYSMFCKTDF